MMSETPVYVCVGLPLSSYSSVALCVMVKPSIMNWSGCFMCVSVSTSQLRRCCFMMLVRVWSFPASRSPVVFQKAPLRWCCGVVWISCFALPFLLGCATCVLNQCALVCCRCLVSWLACHCCRLCGEGLLSVRRWLGVLLFCGVLLLSLKVVLKNRLNLWHRWVRAVFACGVIAWGCGCCLLFCRCSLRCERVRLVRSYKGFG